MDEARDASQENASALPSVNDSATAAASPSSASWCSDTQSRKRKTWSQLKSIVELSRKLMSSLGNDVAAYINFRERTNPESGQRFYRVYLLASTQKRESTIKYIDAAPDMQCEKLVAKQLFQSPAPDTSTLEQTENKEKLTKEEQLLRERKRCVFTGITSYVADESSSRLVFSERSELFCLDDDATQVTPFFYLIQSLIIITFAHVIGVCFC
jgi:flagellar hook-length control protein FliK